MRAYARGELGFPGKEYAEAAAFVSEMGWKTTTENIKDAKRRGRLELHCIDKFTQEEREFVKAVLARWPHSRMHDLLE